MGHELIDPVIQQLELKLPTYLAGRRWYRAKAQTIAALRIRDIIQADGFPILLIDVQSEGGSQELYLLPIHSDAFHSHVTGSSEEPIAIIDSSEGEKVIVSDAVNSPFFRTILLRALTAGAEFKGRSGSLIAPASTHPVPIEGTLSSSVSRAEQSNTSIIYGREFILKLFRKIEPGINPDAEIGAFLTAQGFKNIPAVVGTLEYRSESGEAYSAGILQEFVENQGDAWKYTLDALSAFYARALDSKLDDPELLGDYREAARLLGARTAEMHIALSAPTDDQDFTAEPFTPEDAQKLSGEIAAQAKTSFELLRGKVDTLPDAEKKLGNRVLDLQPRIIEAFSNVAAASTDAKRIRHHGDYHLGQVLATGSDFMIIDFEGEPARPLSERRTKALALRDVAGMLRSFQYAAYAGLYGLVPGLATDAESAEKIAACSAFWSSQVSKLYLDGYMTKADSHAFVPGTPEQSRVFLDAFLLEKALYEVQYELNNRPAWVGIPLRGILSLIES